MRAGQNPESLFRACLKNACAAPSTAIRLMAGLIIALVLAGPAIAAPQMLVLLESGGRLPLQCAEARCVVELAAMCLQPERRMPLAGRHYRTTDMDAITVAGFDETGTAVRRRLPVGARLTALRSHTAVRLEISAVWLGQNFAALQGVAVQGGAILEPVVIAGDAKPMTRAETRQVKDRAVSLARGAFAGNPGSVLTARVSNYLINALPKGKTVQPGALETAWRNALARIPANAEDLSTTRFLVNYCQYSADNGLAASLQSCLQGRQDRALEDLHQDYINALGTGS